MYIMKKCIKCGSEGIAKGSLSGPSTLSLSGIPDWLGDYVTYTCTDCGYTELVKEMNKIKSHKGSVLGG